MKLRTSLFTTDKNKIELITFAVVFEYVKRIDKDGHEAFLNLNFKKFIDWLNTQVVIDQELAKNMFIYLLDFIRDPLSFDIDTDVLNCKNIRKWVHMVRENKLLFARYRAEAIEAINAYREG